MNRWRLFVLGVMCLFVFTVGSYATEREIQAISLSIMSPTENQTVNAGQTVYVYVYFSGSVAGIQSITCQGDGDSAETVSYGMYPPKTSGYEYFYYNVPSSATPGSTLSINVELQDYVDDPVYATRHVKVSSSATPTPSPTPAPAYESISYSGTVARATYDQSRDYLYLMNQTYNRVDIVDVSARAIIGNIALGSKAVGGDITSDSSKLYIGGGNANIKVVDLASQTVSQTLDFSSIAAYSTDSVYDIALGQGKAWMSVTTSSYSEYLVELDLNTETFAKISPYGPYSYFDSPIVDASTDDRFLLVSDTYIMPSHGAVYDCKTGVLNTEDTYNYIYFASLNSDGSYVLWDRDVYDNTLSNLMATTTITWHYGRGLFLPNKRTVAVGFLGNYSSDYANIIFYDVEQKRQLQSMTGLSTASYSDYYFLVPNADGTMLFMIGMNKVYFIPIDYITDVNSHLWNTYE